MSATPIDDGGPAYPAPDLGQRDFGDRSAYPGMTLRDHFAGEALRVVIANPAWAGVMRGYEFAEIVDEIADEAYTLADAMLRVRKAGASADPAPLHDAAPALLSAARQAESILPHLCDLDESPSVQQVVDELRVAIRKAEGKA